MSKKLDMQVVNEAMGGSSNQKIYRTTMEWTSEYLNNGKDPESLFVIIGWSHPGRIELRHNNKWVDILGNWKPANRELRKLYEVSLEFIFDELRDHTLTILNIIALQSWLKANNISYLFFDALDIIYQSKFTDIQEIIKQVDISRYYHFNSKDKNMYHSCKLYPSGPRGHPLEEAQIFWANTLEEFIEENGLV